MCKETCKTTKFIDFKIQKYSLNMTIPYHSNTLILFLSHSAHAAHHQFPANRLFRIIQLIQVIPEPFP